ncbi:hypothetical protein GCM10008967_16250 [Bacillus carboniphilus]|uniref:Uncharacterized protein n=1 Tax=Bacillus carboniphilus TaxID=86663 RepID=A0ABN0W644_9BACI
MFKKLTVCGLVFVTLFGMAWMANEHHNSEYEFIEWDQEIGDLNLMPLSTEGGEMMLNKKMLKKFRSREYVRISTAS